MSESRQQRAMGSCLCGLVRFSIHGALRDVSYCHCLMCQRASSHFVAYTACDPSALVVADTRRKLRWYRSSPNARRGFCGACGSQLFWAPAHGRHISVSAGSLDQPTGLHPGKHLHLDHRPDYDRELDARVSGVNSAAPREAGVGSTLAGSVLLPSGEKVGDRPDEGGS